MMNDSKLTPGNYFIEMAFQRPMTEENLRRALVKMGFTNIEMDKTDDFAVGAISLALNTSVSRLPSASTSLASTAVVKPATTLATPAPVPKPTASSPQFSTNVIPVQAPSAGSPTPYLPSAPSQPLLATPTRPTTPTGSSPQYSMQPAPSQSLATPSLPDTPTGSSPQYSMSSSPLLATPSRPETPTGSSPQYSMTSPSSLLATPTKPATPFGGSSPSSPLTTATDPEATNANDTPSTYASPGDPGGGSGAGGGGGDQTPGPNDQGAQPLPDYSAPPQPVADYQPPQGQDVPSYQDDASQNSQSAQDTLALANGGAEAAVAQLAADLAKAQAAPLPPETRWHRWVEWGSPFAVSPPHLTNVSGEEEETITRYRFVATLSQSFVATNAPDMSWVFIRRLAINPFADLSFQVFPFKLTRGGLYEFRFFSRLKTSPTKDDVKKTLEGMGFSPMKLSLLKKNMRIPHRNNVVSFWLGVGQWSAPNSVVTTEDPFFFETVKEVKP